jgi:hypothetical protein
MIGRLTVAAVMFVSGALLGGCASGPMASVDQFPALAIPVEGPGMVFPEGLGVGPQPTPRSAGEMLQTQ